MIIGLSGYIGSGKDTVGNIIRYLDTAKRLIERKEIDTIVPFSEYNEKEMLVATNWEIKKFAYKLKQIASILTGIPQEMFEDQEFKKQNMSEEWWNKEWERSYDAEINEQNYSLSPVTYREFLQRLGTEAIRNNIHENAWVNALFADYKPSYNVNFPVQTLDIWHPKEEREVEVEANYPNWIITDVRFPNEGQAIKDRGGIVVRINRFTHDSMYFAENPRHSSETALDDWEFDWEIDNDDTIDILVRKVKEMLIHYKIL